MIFKTAAAAIAITRYLGIIDSVDPSIRKLLHQAFNSARMNLEYARDAKPGKLQNDYIKQAKTEFINAMAVEQDENLVSAHIGLAMCQHLLNDTFNAIKTIQKISEIQLSDAEVNKAIAKDALLVFNPIIGFCILKIKGELIKGNHLYLRSQALIEYKNKALICLKEIEY